MEVTIDQALNILRSEEARLQEITARINQTLALINELKLARATIKNLQEKKEKALLPIGGGVFLPADVSGGDKLLINIGAGVVVEKTRKEALEFLDSRIKLADKTLAGLSKEAERISRNISVIRSKIEEAVKNQQGPAVVG